MAFLRSQAIFLALVTASLVGCGIGNDPALTAAAIVKESVRSPSTFQYVSGNVLWTGQSEDNYPAYIVKIVYDAQNGFGATVRGCAMVAYAQKSGGNAAWKRDSGVNTGCEDTMSIAQFGGEQKYVEMIASMNDFTNEQTQLPAPTVPIQTAEIPYDTSVGSRSDAATSDTAVNKTKTVQSLGLGKSISDDNTIRFATNSFSPLDKIYASVATNGPEGNLSAIWKYQDGQIVHTENTQLSVGPHTTSFFISNTQKWPLGRYKIEILVNNNTTASAYFDVE